jgi:protein-tyrosine phosphatase
MNSLQPLLVNCPDGRSGVVIALYFMEFYKFSSSEAIEKVQEKG